MDQLQNGFVFKHFHFRRSVRLQVLHGSQGASQVLFLTLMMVFLFAAFGVLALMLDWELKAKSQLRANTCVGSQASELHSVLNQLSRSNQVLKALRKVAILSVLQPQAHAAVRKGIQLTVLFQDIQMKRWIYLQSKWLLLGGCARKEKSKFLPLPNNPYFRPGVDVLGALPLRLRDPNKKKYRVSLAVRGRAAIAEIRPSFAGNKANPRSFIDSELKSLETNDEAEETLLESLPEILENEEVTSQDEEATKGDPQWTIGWSFPNAKESLLLGVPLL